MRVLVVDDDPIFRGLFCGVLRHNDISELESVASGPEALRLVERYDGDFDCIFVDIEMPEMNGVELVRHLRKLDPRGNSQIVMVTAMQDRQYVDDAFTAGALDYITKPLDALEFKIRLASIRRNYEARLQEAAIRIQLYAADGAKHRIDFEDAVALPEVTGLITLDALRNYLKIIARPRYAMSQRIGIQVENAPNIYVRTGDEEFLDIMADVAETCLEKMSLQNCMMAYVGSGEFITVSSDFHLRQTEDMESAINGGLDAYMGHYSIDFVPTVRIGEPVRGSFFSRQPIDDIIAETLYSARVRPLNKPAWKKWIA